MSILPILQKIEEMNSNLFQVRSLESTYCFRIVNAQFIEWVGNQGVANTV